MKLVFRILAGCLFSAATGALFCQAPVITPPTRPISVNVYALVNTGVAATSNVTDSSGSSGTQVTAGGQGFCCGSRLGVSAAAAFGGGLGGVLQLETGFLFNTGQLDQDQQIFGRQAYIGFTAEHGKLFNVVAIGRQYNAAFVSTAPYDPYGHGAALTTAWDTALYGGRFDNSIQDVLTVGRTAKVIFQYSPGQIAGSAAKGTTLGGGTVINLKPVIFGGTVSHSEDLSNRALDIYGGGARYRHKALTLYAYGYDTRRDGGFDPTGGSGTANPAKAVSALATADTIGNAGNPFRREDRNANASFRYDIGEQYSMLGQYKFNKAIAVNAANGSGTEATYMLEGARGVTKDFFLYTFVSFTKLTGAELTDLHIPYGNFAGASSRAYGGVGLNYRFNVTLK